LVERRAVSMDQKAEVEQTPIEYEIIWVSSFRHKKSGKIIYAHHYGKKAFPIRVPKNRAS
jgi:hypothetical protein